MAKHLRISGRVQGVGYRAAFEQEARARHLSGWVRNRLDGSVEALLDGDAAAVDAMIDWARRGPLLARVERVEVSDADERLMPGQFQRLPTV